MKKLLFGPLKQCLSGHVMQLIEIITNTLKVSVKHFFMSYHVNESWKKYIVHHFHRQRSQITGKI